MPKWIEMKRVLPKVMKLKQRNYLIEVQDERGKRRSIDAYWNGISFRNNILKWVIPAKNVKRIALPE